MSALVEVIAKPEVEAARAPACGRLESFSIVNPLEDSRWDALLAGRADGSFFHGAAWARVLHETYGHSPVYFCRLANGQLEELLPVMEVSSPVTGRRGVSLPFTDFSAPLKTENRSLRPLCDFAMQQGRERGWRYLECRSSAEDWQHALPSLTFYGHEIHLQVSQAALFKGLDGAVRRGIRKAEEAGLQVEFSNSLEAIQIFYGLHCETRRRHGVPPQPFRFFENIARHVLQQGHGLVAIARTKGKPIASAVFFHQGRQAIYKFGASDYAFQHLRPNNLVMWEAIRRYATDGFARLHLGRTSLANEGLRRFKLGFGSAEERLEYWKYDFRRRAYVTGVDRAEGWVNRVFGSLPIPLLRLAGSVLYPHLS